MNCGRPAKLKQKEGGDELFSLLLFFSSLYIAGFRRREGKREKLEVPYDRHIHRAERCADHHRRR